MIEELNNDIQILYKRNKIQITNYEINIIILYLLYLKKCCELNKFKYEIVIHSDTFYDIIHVPALIKSKITNVKPLFINGLLRNIANVKASEMALDLISNNEKIIEEYPTKGKKLVYNTRIMSLYSSYLNLESYDKKGNTTYLIKDTDNNNCYEIFRILDEILDVHNEYKKMNEIELKDYKYIFIYDHLPRYLINKSINNIYDFIRRNINDVEEIILYTEYSKIGNFREGRFIVEYLKNVIIKDRIAVLIFDKNAQEISIINYNNPKITSFEKLMQIRDNNRKQKDILIKVTSSDIKKNNMRIGFNLYQMEKDDDDIDINKIVDDNTELLKQLNALNETVEKQIDNLFNM